MRNLTLGSPSALLMTVGVVPTAQAETINPESEAE